MNGTRAARYAAIHGADLHLCCPRNGDRTFWCASPIPAETTRILWLLPRLPDIRERRAGSRVTTQASL